MSLDALLPSPVRFLEGRLGRLRAPEVLRGYEAYFEERGKAVSEAVDRAAFYASLEPSTPASRMEAEARQALAEA